jgi:NDP-sugar pyrophosphorylase family protein
MPSSELSTTTAAILAGGFGTRLRPVISDRPKVLAEICGRPFLTYLFDQLLSFHINHVVLCTGYMGDRIRETIGNTYGSLMIEYSQESLPLGTAGALRYALNRFNSDQILILNGDSYYKTNIATFWNWHKSKEAFASLLLTKVADTQRYGRVETDSQGSILKFNEKGERSGPGLINAGIYLMDKQLIFSIPPEKCVSLERELFPMWIGQKIYGYHSEGQFIDIGTPEDYANAASFFMKGNKDDNQ